MSIDDQLTSQLSDGILWVTMKGDFSQRMLLEAVRAVAEQSVPLDEARVLIRRVDAPHSALRVHEHVYSLQSEVVPSTCKNASRFSRRQC